MRIAIDARLINESGIGRYIRNLLDNLSQVDKKNSYIILLKKKDIKNFNFGQNFNNVIADFGWYSLAEQVKLPKLLNSLNPDLVHFPHFNIPILYKGKFVVTIHDLIHQKFEMKRASTHNALVYKIKQLGYKKVFKTALNNSQKIITVSDYVKKQLEDEWKVQDKKIVVTKEAAEEELLKLAKNINEKESKEIMEKLRVKQPFIFYVGNAHPHKNVEGLIKAFLNLRQKYQFLHLVLSGNSHYFWEKIIEKYHHKDIIYTGFISDEELVTLYKNAKVFVLPSLEEGFGIPVLESFALGCPVVCSDIGSLREVGGEGCLYFNPKDTLDISAKLEQVLNEDKLAKQLKEKGEKRYKSFSWKKLAEETLNIYGAS